MKLLHLADLHLGKTVCDFSMIEDQKAILRQILDIVSSRGIDAVLIAGDVYDKPVPSEDAVRLLDDFLCRLSQAGVETFLVSGNHDSDERLHFGSELFRANGIYISSKYDGTIFKKECRDEYGRVNIYLLPFVKASQVKHFYPDADIRSYDDAVRTALTYGEIDPEERNILVAHQFVAGRGGDPCLGGSEGAAVRSVGTVEKVGADCFADFDYVALGHIHSPQRVGRDAVRYAGSPLKYSLSEVADEKSVPIVTLGEKGDVSVELVGLKPLRDMRRLKGKLARLLDGKNILSPDDYIYATLTDEDPIRDAMGIFRQYYKNTMKIDYDNAHTRGAEGNALYLDTASVTREKAYSELISDFYALMYGCDISREELRVMEETAREAGVVDEAG